MISIVTIGWFPPQEYILQGGSASLSSVSQSTSGLPDPKKILFNGKIYHFFSKNHCKHKKAICSRSAQFSKGRTELKINVLIFGSNDIFCTLNELLHWKKYIIYHFISENLDFYRINLVNFILYSTKRTINHLFIPL